MVAAVRELGFALTGDQAEEIVRGRYACCAPTRQRVRFHIGRRSSPAATAGRVTTAAESCFRFDVLTYDLWVPCGDSEERQRRSFRAAAVLFPVAQGANADADRGSKLDLRKPDKPAQRHHVGTRLESAPHEASANTCPNRGGELALRQFDRFIQGA